MDLLVAGERVELLDAGLHVVPGDPLALGDGGEVDLVEHPLVVGERRLGHLDPQVGFWARSTASHSWRSSMTFCSGDQRTASSAEA